MDNTTYSNARPTAAKVALTLLALDFGVGFVRQIFNFEFNHYVMFGIWLIEDILFFVLLWCAFCGKNWARWFIVIWTFFLEICVSPLVWARYHQTFSMLGALWFWFSYLLDIVALIVLFHSSSNRWFRGNKSRSATLPVPAADAH